MLTINGMFGVIILHVEKDERGGKRYCIIDGRHRVATWLEFRGIKHPLTYENEDKLENERQRKYGDLIDYADSLSKGHVAFVKTYNLTHERLTTIFMTLNNHFHLNFISRIQGIKHNMVSLANAIIDYFLVEVDRRGYELFDKYFFCSRRRNDELFAHIVSIVGRVFYHQSATPECAFSSVTHGNELSSSKK